MTDNEKLELCEKNLKRLQLIYFQKKITSEEYTIIFDKYSLYVKYYRRKLNKPDLFDSEKDDKPDELL